LGEKKNGINDFKWMTTSIAFGGPYAIDGEISFCNTYIFKLCYAPHGPLMKIHDAIICRYCNTFYTWS
jgi:hypothetical protein